MARTQTNVRAGGRAGGTRQSRLQARARTEAANGRVPRAHQAQGTRSRIISQRVYASAQHRGEGGRARRQGGKPLPAKGALWLFEILHFEVFLGEHAAAGAADNDGSVRHHHPEIPVRICVVCCPVARPHLTVSPLLPLPRPDPTTCACCSSPLAHTLLGQLGEPGTGGRKRSLRATRADEWRGGSEEGSGTDGAPERRMTGVGRRV